MKARKDILNIHKSLGRPLILDGAIGSLLQSQINITNENPMWTSLLNLSEPKLVSDIHREYISAGAEIITTNTFRTNPAILEKTCLLDKANDIVGKSVALVYQAMNEEENDNIIVAGSNPPAEDCYQKKRTLSPSEIEYNHKKHIELLWENGCDFILNETQSHFDEIKIISNFCTENNIPFAMSLFFDNSLNILSGESLSKVISYLSSFPTIAISINCIGQKEFDAVILQNYFSFINGIYLNAGSGNYTDEQITCGVQPKEYLEMLKLVINNNFVFVGSCCCSNPKHTQLLKEYFSE